MHMLTIFMLQDIGGGGRPLFFHEVTNRPFPLSNVFTQSWNFNFPPAYPAFYNFEGDWHGWGGDLFQRISWCRQSHWVQVFDFQIFITINIIIVIAMITIKHSHKPNHHSKARFEGGSMHNNHHDHLQVRLEDGAMYPKQRLQLLRRNLRSGNLNFWKLGINKYMIISKCQTSMKNNARIMTTVASSPHHTQCSRSSWDIMLFRVGAWWMVCMQLSLSTTTTTRWYHEYHRRHHDHDCETERPRRRRRCAYSFKSNPRQPSFP